MLALGTIVLGLAVHLGGDALAPATRDVLGDAIWAMMMMWWVSAAVPRAPLYARVVGALVICVAVEFSQLHHTLALDAIRRTLAGRLVLGSGFDARDLVAYLAGVMVAGTLELAQRRFWR